jgi:hypothetical protein
MLIHETSHELPRLGIPAEDIPERGHSLVGGFPVQEAGGQFQETFVRFVGIFHGLSPFRQRATGAIE